jgi:hypothetical protein
VFVTEYVDCQPQQGISDKTLKCAVKGKTGAKLCLVYQGLFFV